MKGHREKVAFMGTKETREKIKAAGRKADERRTKGVQALSIGGGSVVLPVMANFPSPGA